MREQRNHHLGGICSKDARWWDSIGPRSSILFEYHSRSSYRHRQSTIEAGRNGYVGHKLPLIIVGTFGVLPGKSCADGVHFLLRGDRHSAFSVERMVQRRETYSWGNEEEATRVQFWIIVLQIHTVCVFRCSSCFLARVHGRWRRGILHATCCVSNSRFHGCVWRCVYPLRSIVRLHWVCCPQGIGRLAL